jgi:hypothetical protein
MLPFVPVLLLYVGGSSLWKLMQPDVVEVFRQQSWRGVSFGRRRLVITLTFVLPLLALVCTSPLLMTRLQLARLDSSHTDRSVGSPVPVDAAPSPDAPSPYVDGNVGTVRMANDGDVAIQPFDGVLIDYAPHQYDRQQITLFGDSKQENAIVFIFDCSDSMAQTTMLAPQAAGGRPQRTERMSLAKNHFASMLDDLARGNANGANTRVGVRFFGHRLSWEKPPADAPPGWVSPLITQSEYQGEKAEGLAPSEDVELVQPLGRFDRSEAEKIRQRLQSVQPWGETPLYLALMQALDDFGSEAQNTRKSIVVITDGENYQSLFNPGGPKPEASTI